MIFYCILKLFSENFEQCGSINCYYGECVNNEHCTCEYDYTGTQCEAGTKCNHNTVRKSLLF